MQAALALTENGLGPNVRDEAAPFGSQLLKWIGNKQRLAPAIINHFPERFGTYFEPFLGSGGVLATLSPRVAEGSDCFGPLIEIWHALAENPSGLVDWYRARYELVAKLGKVAAYETVKKNYNQKPNGQDFVFLTRACYAGVVRFRQRDGYMSTPCGPHDPITPASFARRVQEWNRRTSGTTFYKRDYKEAFARARAGDLIYCDPPYSHSQAILYGAQAFELEELYSEIFLARARGVLVALSIDGTKKSGSVECDVKVPRALFKREVSVNLGKSMLRRLQLEGETLESELVTDRLLLTF